MGYKHIFLCTPKLLEKFKCAFKVENNKRRKNWGTIPSSQHYKGEKGVLSSGMGTRTNSQVRVQDEVNLHN